MSADCEECCGGHALLAPQGSACAPWPSTFCQITDGQQLGCQSDPCPASCACRFFVWCWFHDFLSELYHEYCSSVLFGIYIKVLHSLSSAGCPSEIAKAYFYACFLRHTHSFSYTLHVKFVFLNYHHITCRKLSEITPRYCPPEKKLLCVHD